MKAEVKQAYFDILKSRLEYFESKPITELSDEEIQEYDHLKKEIKEQIMEISSAIGKVVRSAFEVISEVIEGTPAYEAAKLYTERVLLKGED